MKPRGERESRYSSVSMPITALPFFSWRSAIRALEVAPAEVHPAAEIATATKAAATEVATAEAT